MAGSGFDFQKFINDSKSSIMNPKGFFASMAKDGGFVEPVIKALIYGIVAGVISMIWFLLNLYAAKWGLFGVGAGFVLLNAVVGAVIGLFIGGIIVLIVSAICGGSTNYEANVRVTASLMVLSPINALLSFLGALNLTLGMIVGVIVSLYGLYMFYNALVKCLGAKEGTAKIICIILAAIVLIFMLSGLFCGSKMANV
jgi:hypothetical protein